MYVCDVNGWSFVKGNYKFYDACGRIFHQIFSDGLISKGLPYIKLDNRIVLRGVVGVFRHADRTPKQKIKIKTRNREMIGLCQPRKELKYRSSKFPTQIKRISETFNLLLKTNPEDVADIIQQISLLQSKTTQNYHPERN